MEDFKKNIALQNKFRVPKINNFRPSINIDEVIAASWNPTDGKADPFLAVTAFARKAKEYGTKI